MLMFIIYTFILFICGNYIGKLILKKDNKIYSLRSIIGFVILLGLLQIFYYPIMYFNLNSIYHLIITGIILLTTFILGLIKLEKDDFFFIKSYEFYIILIFVFLIFRLCPGIDASDDVFYISYIIDNSKGLVNTIDPYSGLEGFLDSYHSFRGLYLLTSLLYKIQGFISNSVINGFIAYRSTLSLLFIIYSSIIYVYIKSLFKNINKYLYLLIELLSFVLIGTSEWANIHLGSFCLVQIFIPLLMILVNYYINNKNDKYIKYIILIFGMGLNSLSSAPVYLGIMVISCFIGYELLNKKEIKVEDYLLMLLPYLFNACLFLDELKYFVLLIIVYIIVKIFSKNINKFINRIGKYIIYSIPIIFTILNYFKGYGFGWNYGSGYGILGFNLLFSLVLLYLIYKKENINSYLFIFLLTIIIYFNPLTGGLVAKYFTTKGVYHRIFCITKNPLVIISLFITLYNYFNKKKLFKYSLIIFMVLLTGLYGYKMINNTLLNDNYFGKYNYFSKDMEYNIELGEYLNTIEDNSKILSMNYSVRNYNPKLISNVYRYAMNGNWKEDLEDNIIDLEKELYYVTMGKENINDNYLELIKDYDYIITLRKTDSDIKSIYEKVYSNEYYEVYKVN